MHKLLKYLYDNYDNRFCINDISAWNRYSSHNIIYNKLQLADIQGLSNAPIPIYPNKYPVIIKPIINLYGMSRGLYKVNNLDEYEYLINNNNLSGSFWETFLDGKQINVDIIMKEGKIIKYYGVESEPDVDGTFKYHKYIEDYILDKNIKDIIEELLDDYTGFLNIEIINNFIIEAHLRLNGDFFIFTKEHIDNLINFMKTGNFIDLPIIPTTFFPIFITDTTKEYKNINYYLKKNMEYLIDYQKDKIFGSCQGDKYKRCYYYITNNFQKGLELQTYIYNNFVNN